MNIGTRSLRPRKLHVPIVCREAELPGVNHNEEKDPAGLLQSLLEQMMQQRCTPHAAELLLTTMTTHFVNLEANHQELMSVIMARIYLEVVTTDDPLVRLNLLQLVETRARLWRHDSATDKFYANRKLSTNEQTASQRSHESRMLKKILYCALEQMKKCDNSSHAVSEDIQREQLKAKSVRDQMHEQRLVISDKVEIRLFSNCNTTLQDSYTILQNYYRKKHLMTENSLSQSIAPSVDLVQSREPGLNTSLEDKWVGSRGERINANIDKQLLINNRCASLNPESLTEHSINCKQIKASSDEKQSKAVDCMQKSMSDSVTVVAVAAGRIEEEISQGRTESKSCEPGVQQEDVINDRVQTDDKPNRYATPDLLSEGSDLSAVSDTEDEFAESCTSPINESKPENEAQLQTVAQETGAGDCMMAVETKSGSGWAGWQRVIDCSTSDVKVHCDDGDGSGEEATNLCTEGATNSQLIQYKRGFLLSCGSNVSVDNLPISWPELCATFKGVCLPPEEAPQWRLSNSFPVQYSIVRMNGKLD